MWLKVVLMTAFMLLLILLSRLMDMALSGNRSQLLSTHIFLNTIGFSVKQLKRLLDTRGISYDSVVEKKELIDLVDASGGVTEEELINVNERNDHFSGDETSDTSNDNSNTNHNKELASNDKTETRFTCGTHFYEEVEDTKDSAWIVNVMPIDGNALAFDNKLWKQIVDKSNEFGIRSGVFDCSLDPYLCEKKRWTSARLILALPREGIKMKEDVVMKTLLIGQHIKKQKIFDWIHKHLANRVSKISSLEDLEKNWLQSKKSDDSIGKAIDVKFIFISTLATPPLILSALAIKFSGRIKFGMFTVTDTKKKKSLINKLNKRIPVYLIVMSDRHYYYGYKAGENIRYRSMELLLRTLKPEMNDLFLLSLFVTNLSVGLYFFYMKCSKLWKHIVYWFMHFIKYNCILFLIWLTFMTLYQFPLTERFCTYGYYVCQYLAITQIATIIRYDIQYYYTIPFLLTAFLSLGIFIAFIRRKLVSSSIDDNDDHLVFRDWTPWESTLLSYILFRPITMNSFRPMSTTSIDINLEEGMELLIERLAVPNLWLQTELICSDYIKELPVWRHQIEKSKELELSSDSNNGNIVTNDNNEFSLHSDSELSSNAKSKFMNTGCTINSCLNNTQSLTSSHISSDHIDRQYNQCCDCSRSSKSDIQLKQCTNKLEEHTKHEQQLRSSRDKSQLNNENDCKQVENGCIDKSSDNSIPDGMIKCNECAICLEVYRKAQHICGLPCGHNYHQNCIMLWLYRDNHCCPTCRWPTYKQRPKLF